MDHCNFAKDTEELLQQYFRTNNYIFIADLSAPPAILPRRGDAIGLRPKL